MRASASLRNSTINFSFYSALLFSHTNSYKYANRSNYVKNYEKTVSVLSLRFVPSLQSAFCTDRPFNQYRLVLNEVKWFLENIKSTLRILLPNG